MAATTRVTNRALMDALKNRDDRLAVIEAVTGRMETKLDRLNGSVRANSELLVRHSTEIKDLQQGEATGVSVASKQANKVQALEISSARLATIVGLSGGGGGILGALVIWATEMVKGG